MRVGRLDRAYVVSLIIFIIIYQSASDLWLMSDGTMSDGENNYVKLMKE